MRNPLSSPFLYIGAGLALAGGAGYFAAGAISSNLQGTTTVTVNVGTGSTGAQGPPGPPGPKGDTGPQGPAGSVSCPTGFQPGDLVINHPGGQVTVYACLK